MEVTWKCWFYTFLIYLNYAWSWSPKAFLTDMVLILDAQLQGFFQNINDYFSEKHQANLHVLLCHFFLPILLLVLWHSSFTFWFQLSSCLPSANGSCNFWQRSHYSNAIANRAQKNPPYTYCLKKQRLGLDYKRFADVSVHANSPFCTCSLSKLWSRLTFLPTRKVSWCFLLHRHQLCKQYQGLHPSHYYTGKTSGLVYMPQREFTFLLFK